MKLNITIITNFDLTTIKIISIDGIARQPTPKIKNIFIKKFKWRLQLLFKNQ